MLQRILTQTAVLTLMLALTLVTGCGTDNENMADSAVGDNSAPAGVAVGGTKGAYAPDFTLNRLDGTELTLSNLRGKAVIIDFWDTWCPPCRKALPHLQELSETYGDDLVVVGVAFGREGADKVRAYTQQHGLTFEMVLYNEKSTILEDFGGIQSIPTTFLIDEKGIVREKWVGAADKVSYENAVVAAISDKG